MKQFEVIILRNGEMKKSTVHAEDEYQAKKKVEADIPGDRNDYSIHVKEV